MTASHNQWLSPAHAGEWSMDVDDRRQPARLILHRGPEKVLTLPIASVAGVSAAVDRVVAGAGVPRGVANQLVTQLTAKLTVTGGRPSQATSG